MCRCVHYCPFGLIFGFLFRTNGGPRPASARAPRCSSFRSCKTVLMDHTAAMAAAPAPAHERESVELRTRRLAAARRRATALLGAVTVLFVAVTVAGAHGTFLGYVQAGAEASMVGGVADWFA